jgi:hypothetical protein
MALILKNGALFLHIPKTGGTWVTKVLREGGLLRCSIGHRHANLDHLLAPGWQGLGRKLEWCWKRSRYLRTHPRPFTFCFVRHPLDWYESFYLYKNQPSLNWERDGDLDNFHRWHPNAVLNGLGEGKEFNEFVTAVMDRAPGYVSALFSHYTFRPCDFVGKQENLREDLVTGQRGERPVLLVSAPGARDGRAQADQGEGADGEERIRVGAPLGRHVNK